MTGPEHYREAEKLLVSCQLTKDDEHEVYPEVGLGHEDDVDSCRNALLAAHVHATLAQAAATLDVQLNEHLLAAWAEVLS